jgi:WD40 repeat protein
MQTSKSIWFFLAVVVMTAFGYSDQDKISFHLDNTDVPSAAFTPDSKYIVSGGYHKISLLDISSHQWIDRFAKDQSDKTGLGARMFEVIAVSPDGKFVASAAMGAAYPVKLWDFQTGKLLQTFDTKRTEIRALAFSPDSKQLAAGTALRQHDGPKPYEAVYEIWLWDIDQKGSDPIRFQGNEAPLESMVFLPDGKRIISINSVRIMRVWDIETRKELKRSGTWTPPALLKPFSPGSRFSGFDEGASGWLGNTYSVFTLQISADGKHVVCGRTVWDTENLKLEYFADGLRLWKDFDEWHKSNLSEPINEEDKESNIKSWFAYAYEGALTPDNSRLVIVGSFGLHGKFGGEGNLTPEGKKLINLSFA